jgi:flavin-binding protein dodecin
VFDVKKLCTFSTEAVNWFRVIHAIKRNHFTIDRLVFVSGMKCVSCEVENGFFVHYSVKLHASES